LKWAASRDDPKVANKLFRQHHVLYKRLRETEQGRRIISDQLQASETPVRLLAATHTLGWDPEVATRVLKEIEQQDGEFGVDAKWTLRSHARGSLNLDW
jgi:hypothetical protein